MVSLPYRFWTLELSPHSWHEIAVCLLPRRKEPRNLEESWEFAASGNPGGWVFQSQKSYWCCSSPLCCCYCCLLPFSIILPQWVLVFPPCSIAFVVEETQTHSNRSCWRKRRCCKAEEEEFHFWQKLVFILGGWLLFFLCEFCHRSFWEEFFFGRRFGFVGKWVLASSKILFVGFAAVGGEEEEEEGRKEGRASFDAVGVSLHTNLWTEKVPLTKVFSFTMPFSSCFLLCFWFEFWHERERERERDTHTHTHKGVLWVPCFLEELKDAHRLGCWVVVWTLDSELVYFVLALLLGCPFLDRKNFVFLSIERWSLW